MSKEEYEDHIRKLLKKEIKKVMMSKEDEEHAIKACKESRPLADYTTV